MTIHKEGRKLLGGLIVVLVIVNGLLYYFLREEEVARYVVLGASIILFLLILQFFRSPRIVTPKNEKHVVAPADGKVVVIEETEETEYLKDRRKQISIFMSPVNVHVNRSPIHGIIKMFKYHPGKYLVAWHPKSSLENERTTMVLKTTKGTEIVVRQIAGAMARRIRWYVEEGNELQQGEEFGFIKFGSRVDVFVPLDAKIKVDIGTKTKGGMTVLAEL